MPGLNQLKQFSTDILTLGDEQKIRAARGEKAPVFPIPDDIEDRDDSEDFVLGMPQVSEDELAQAEAAAIEKEKEANDYSDITGEKSDDSETKQVIPQASKLPDVSDLLEPSADENFSDIDLSAFEEPAKPKEPEKPKEIPIEDLDLDALLAPTTKKGPETKKEEPVVKQPIVEEKKTEIKKEETDFPPELQELFDNDAPKDTKASDTDFNFDIPEPTKFEEPKIESQQDVNNDSISELEPFETLEPIDAESKAEENNSEQEETTSQQEEIPPSEAIPSEDTSLEDEDFAFDGKSIDLNEELPDDLKEEPPAPKTPIQEDTESEPQEDDFSEIPEMPSFDNINFEEPKSEIPIEEETIPEETSEKISTDEFDTSVLDDIPDFGNEQQPATTEEAQTSEEPNITENKEVESTELPIEQFDTSAIDDMNFSGDNTEQPSVSDSEATDFELGNIGPTENDSFAIPGFSDTQTAEISKARPAVATPDFSGAKTDKKPKNTFTDAEYERFEKNLAEYPLNVRIALEDLVVKNEFTDDAVFQVLEKVLRKVSARQLATDLEKMLDITLDVPRDFERRTAEEYNTYKKSVEYQLKNRIIPGAVITAGAAILIFCIYTIINSLVVIPARANSLYKKGYACLQQEEYPQSEIAFDKALSYKPIEKWFFKYAEGYREHKQYERSANMYKAIIQRFNHNKEAGLEWAEMEIQDRFNYEEAERILKRDVLDFHINDPDALLLLGDDYLEWGTEKDPSKFDLAKEQYSLLLQLYGNKDQNLYLSRMMKYNIRTDNLREVLQYKEHFLPLKKALNADDLTELSGYLLDKRYGILSHSEQNLRFNIEDVRELLERAVKANPENPIALYNMGRYFVETDSNSSARSYLQASISSFTKQSVRNKRDTYKYINAYRLMGEQYLSSKEYINAEQTFGDGITLFEKENNSSGFESTQDIGKLYSDLGDLNYFISGNYSNALDSYKKAIENKNDNASVRYRVGYINYINKDYPNALGSFIRSSETKAEDTHLLLSLANTLSLRNDNYAALGYYEKLISELNKERDIHGIMLPQVREDQGDIVDTYMKASNNLGVTLNRIANVTGNSKTNAEAIVNLSESLRAWDALTRNQDTMVRLGSSNLPEMNIKYITNPTSDYTPEIFTDIPRTLNGEKGLEQ